MDGFRNNWIQGLGWCHWDFISLPPLCVTVPMMVGKSRRLGGTKLAFRVESTVLKERTNGRLLSLVTRLCWSSSLLPVRWYPLTDQVWVMGSSHLFGDESMGFPKEIIILLLEDGGSDAKLENNRCLQVYWASTLCRLLHFNWVLWILNNTSG